MPKLELQTTPEMCVAYLDAQAKHGLANSADAWVVQDAASAHVILALLRKAHEALLRSGIQEAECEDPDGACYECGCSVMDGDAHTAECSIHARQEALDAAKPWMEE
jgi:hypothetical protein